MKASLVSLITLLLLLLLHGNLPSVNARTLLEEVCSKAKVPPYATYNFCVKSMQTDPASSTADTRGLFLLALRLAKYNVSSNMYNMDMLSRDQDLAPVARETMANCYNLYLDAVTDLDAVAGEVNAHRHGAVGEQLLAKVLMREINCLDALDKIKNDIKQVVISDNTDAFGLTHLAHKMYDLFN